MAHKTYLQLVNEAIAESKCSLDPLTSLDFAAPPRTMLYERFKAWTNRAYRDILIDRDEWQYRIERASVVLYPRLQVRMVGINVINIGDVLEGDASGVAFQVLNIHSAEDVELDATTEYTISVEYVDGESFADNVILNETFSRTSPAPAANIGSVKGRGTYDLAELVPYIYNVDIDTFYIQELPLSTSEDPYKLTPVRYDQSPYWTRSPFDVFSAASGKPSFVIETQDGNYDFYPRINKPHQLTFSFTQDVQLMVTHDDVPELLDQKYDDLIMWKTVASYADWDERSKLFSRATKEIKRWKFLMDKNELPEITFDTHRFDYDRY